jgi:hypothetical protein
VARKSQQNPRNLQETWGLSLDLCSPPPEYDNAVMRGADLAAQLIRALSESDIFLREVEIAIEKEKNDKDEDKEEMERRQGLL